MDYIDIYKKHIELKKKKEYVEILNNIYFDINERSIRKKNLFTSFWVSFVLMISVGLFLEFYESSFFAFFIGAIFLILSIYNGIEFLDEKSRINDKLKDFFKLFINKKLKFDNSDIFNYIKNDYEYYKKINIDKYKNDIYTEKFFKNVLENIQELNFEEQKEFINHYNEFKEMNKNIKSIKKEMINININNT